MYQYLGYIVSAHERTDPLNPYLFLLPPPTTSPLLDKDQSLSRTRIPHAVGRGTPHIYRREVQIPFPSNFESWRQFFQLPLIYFGFQSTPLFRGKERTTDHKNKSHQLRL
jgi:hypothetical protein